GEDPLHVREYVLNGLSGWRGHWSSSLSRPCAAVYYSNSMCRLLRHGRATTPLAVKSSSETLLHDDGLTHLWMQGAGDAIYTGLCERERETLPFIERL